VGHLGGFLYICIAFYTFLSFLFFGRVVIMSSFSLWKMSSESEVYFGFADDTSRHTRRLASAAWVIFTPRGQLLSFRGICLGNVTNNVANYSAMIKFLRDVFSHGIYRLQVYLDAQLVVS
jgi:hypothetical protein